MCEGFCSMELQVMSPHPLKAAVKRGALIAAANWQVTLIQPSAGSLFRLLLAAPVVGSLFLVALAIGDDPTNLISLEWREMTTTIALSLMSRPTALAACGLAIAVVGIGGSLFVKMYGTFVDRCRDRPFGAVHVYDRASFE